ncbi:hypothetical protein D3C71_24430 [compost metagenome]
MSQNTLVTTSSLGQVRVSAGWDYPLQQLFCNVLTLDDEVEDDEADLPAACFARSAYGDVTELVATLKAGGIELPRQMVEAIGQDVRDQARNILRVFGQDGALQQEHRF